MYFIKNLTHVSTVNYYLYNNANIIFNLIVNVKFQREGQRMPCSDCPYPCAHAHRGKSQ